MNVTVSSLGVIFVNNNKTKFIIRESSLKEVGCKSVEVFTWLRIGPGCDGLFGLTAENSSLNENCAV